MARLLPLSVSVLFTCIGLAACGGGGGDDSAISTTAALKPAAAASAASAPAPAWGIALYDFWARPDVAYGVGTASVSAEGALQVLGRSLKLSAPFGIDSCALDKGACVARQNAAVLSVCVHEGPDLVMLDSRAAHITDLTALRGKSFTAAWACMPSTGKALVSAFGDLTIVDSYAAYPMGALSDWVRSGEFKVRLINTTAGPRHVLIERNFGNNVISAYVED